jgi:predicted DNA-binding protein
MKKVKRIKKPTSVTLDIKTLSALKKLSKTQGTTVSAMIRRMSEKLVSQK